LTLFAPVPRNGGLALSGQETFMDFRNLFDLTGKHVLATGAGGGIGTTVCRGFSDFGVEVACLDINEEIAARIAASATCCEALTPSGDLPVPKV